jgi:hypothetical protein
MELNNIEQLLEKYFEGETSVAEEQQLKEYFNSEHVASHLEVHKPLFSYFSQSNKDKMNFSPILPSKKRIYTVWIGVAASLLFIVGIITFWDKPSAKQEDLGSFEDPEIAFRETQKALAMLSENVNVGIQSLEYVNEYEKTKKTIFK